MIKRALVTLDTSFPLWSQIPCEERAMQVKRTAAICAFSLCLTGCGGSLGSNFNSSGTLPSVAGGWVFSAGNSGLPQALIAANLSQDASGNVTAANGQITAIGDVSGSWIFGDCLANQGDGMEQDRFQGNINAQGQLNGTFYEGQNAWTVSASFTAAGTQGVSDNQLAGTFSPMAENDCAGASGPMFGQGAPNFPTLSVSHTYTGQLKFVSGSDDTVQATFQRSGNTLTANLVVSGTDIGSATLTGYTVGSTFYLSGTFNGTQLQYWGLVVGLGGTSTQIIVYDQVKGWNAGTMQ
jgi:hypothetical protein